MSVYLHLMNAWMQAVELIPTLGVSIWEFWLRAREPKWSRGYTWISALDISNNELVKTTVTSAHWPIARGRGLAGHEKTLGVGTSSVLRMLWILMPKSRWKIFSPIMSGGVRCTSTVLSVDRSSILLYICRTFVMYTAYVGMRFRQEGKAWNGYSKTSIDYYSIQGWQRPGEVRELLDCWQLR